LITAGGEPMDFPKLGAHAIATQVSGQGTTLAGTDPTYLKLTLGAVKFAELVKVSNEVLSDAGIDIGSFLGKDMGRALGRKLAEAFVVGTDPAGLSTGVVGSGTIATGGSLITPTVENLISLQYSVVDEYRNSSAGWLMKDSTAGTLRKLRDGAGGTIGAFLWSPSLTQGIIGGAPDTLLGFPVYTDSNMAASGSAATRDTAAADGHLPRGRRDHGSAGHDAHGHLQPGGAGCDARRLRAPPWPRGSSTGRGADHHH
jgi:HK97 family phage major capsid protein